MALLDLIEVSKAYEAQKVLCKIDFHINEGERIAIIGKNGGGKSTLMKICEGSLDFDEGRRVVQQNIKIEMLPQNPSFKENITVKEAIEAELDELKQKRERFEKVSTLLAKDFENKELLKEHEELQKFLDSKNAWNLDDRIKRVILEFNLKEYENKPVNLLSGGEQRRVALASLLLKKPDILLLDEPTNHLDVYMVEFLEDMLLKERFTLLLISHDRYFIDKLATRTVEIEDCKLRSFKGGYQDYIRAKEELLESMKKSHENLLRLLKREEEWLRRGVKARLKRNEGRKKRVLELREKAKKNPALIRRMQLELEREKKHFNREEGINRKKMLFEIEHIHKKLGDKILIKDFSTRILQKDRIAVVGKNGSGKSTFLKILLGKESVDSGVIKRGDFKIGYFDQHRQMLDDDKNLIETFCPNGGDRVEVRGRNMHVYGYLKNFLFPKEHLDKKIGILSGGEKNRVALALLFTKQYDCLILDEPTNDLDIQTINILEEYLQSFQGALIIVSHDRYFVDKIADKLFIFKGDGEIEESYQSYSEFLEIEKELKEIQKIETNIEKEKKESTKVKKRAKKLSYKEQREYDSLPDIIENLENEVKKISQCLENPNCYNEKGLLALSKELEEKQKELDEAIERFLNLEEKLEEMKENI